jgi:hypothetical protein
MQAFAVVIALLAVAALGWALSAAAGRVLRRHGVPTDERSLRAPAASGSADFEPVEAEPVEAEPADAEPADEGRAGD